MRACQMHRTRHTFAIPYLRNGGDSFTLKDMLGHATMEMVRRYLALTKAHDHAAHDVANPASNWWLRLPGLTVRGHTGRPAGCYISCQLVRCSR